MSRKKYTDTKHNNPCTRGKFTLAKWNAKVRSLDFNFTLEEWLAWWIGNLGEDWQELRGPRGHQYVMARLGDKGPYSLINVKCITASENCSTEKRVNGSCGAHNHLGEKNPKSKLTEKQVREIYWADGRSSEIAQKYSISRCTVNDIKKGRSWSHFSKE